MSSKRIGDNFKKSVDIEASRNKREEVSVMLRTTAKADLMNKMRRNEDSLEQTDEKVTTERCMKLITMIDEMNSWTIGERFCWNTTLESKLGLILETMGLLGERGSLIAASTKFVATIVRMCNAADDGHTRIGTVPVAYTIVAEILHEISVYGPAEIEQLIKEGGLDLAIRFIKTMQNEKRMYHSLSCVLNILIDNSQYTKYIVPAGIVDILVSIFENDQYSTEMFRLCARVMSHLVKQMSDEIHTEDVRVKLVFLSSNLIYSTDSIIGSCAIQTLALVSFTPSMKVAMSIHTNFRTIFEQVNKFLEVKLMETQLDSFNRQYAMRFVAVWMSRSDMEDDRQWMMQKGLVKTVLEVANTNDVKTVTQALMCLQNITAEGRDSMEQLMQQGVFYNVHTIKNKDMMNIKAEIAVLLCMGFTNGTELQKVHLVCSCLAIPSMIASLVFPAIDIQRYCLQGLLAAMTWGKEYMNRHGQGEPDTSIVNLIKKSLDIGTNDYILYNPVKIIIEKVAENKKYDLKSILEQIQTYSKSEEIKIIAQSLDDVVFKEKDDTISTPDDSFVFCPPVNTSDDDGMKE